MGIYADEFVRISKQLFRENRGLLSPEESIQLNQLVTERVIANLDSRLKKLEDNQTNK